MSGERLQDHWSSGLQFYLFTVKILRGGGGKVVIIT